jgi:uncharacterized damage-inducible protein DinB
MEAADREFLLALLADTQQEFCESAKGLSEEQARMRPEPDHWSVLECVEHVCLVEDAMFVRFTTKLAPSEAPADRSREEIVRQIAANRGRKFSAPEHVQPTGRFPSLAAALEHFNQSRARSIEYIRRLELDPHAYTAQHPVAGAVSGQEFLLILAQHPARHAEQIREIRRTLKLPESAT